MDPKDLRESVVLMDPPDELERPDQGDLQDQEVHLETLVCQVQTGHQVLLDLPADKELEVEW